MDNHRNYFTISFLLFLFYFTISSTRAQVGYFTIKGDLNISPQTLYEVEIRDLTGAGTGHDHLEVQEDLFLSGELDIVLVEGYLPDVHDKFEIITYLGNISGTFSGINWPPAMSAQGWLIDYGAIVNGKVTIYGPSSSLPVEFISFTGERKGLDNHLKWVTAAEVDMSHHAIEYSLSGEEFTTIAEIPSKNSTFQEYKYAHHPTIGSLHYYRIRQVDNELLSTWSNIIVVQNQVEDDALIFYPNPARQEIRFIATYTEVIVYDVLGRQVLTSQSSGNILDIQGLQPGLYFLRTDKTPKTHRLLIDK